MAKGIPKKSIILIDDDVDARTMASRVLELEGFAVLQAKNGDEGVSLMREKTCDLVLLDLRMPGRDGWSVLEEMKADPELSAIPVVMFTSSGDRFQVEKAGSRGVQIYLEKPLSVARLKKSVGQALAGE